MGAERNYNSVIPGLERKILRRIFGPTKENQIWRLKLTKN